jgi:hypothetical protein
MGLLASLHVPDTHACKFTEDRQTDGRTHGQTECADSRHIPPHAHDGGLSLSLTACVRASNRGDRRFFPAFNTNTGVWCVCVCVCAWTILSVLLSWPNRAAVLPFRSSSTLWLLFVVALPQLLFFLNPAQPKLTLRYCCPAPSQPGKGFHLSSSCAMLDSSMCDSGLPFPAIAVGTGMPANTWTGDDSLLVRCSFAHPCAPAVSLRAMHRHQHHGATTTHHPPPTHQDHRSPPSPPPVSPSSPPPPQHQHHLSPQHHHRHHHHHHHHDHHHHHPSKRNSKAAAPLLTCGAVRRRDVALPRRSLARCSWSGGE